MKIDVLDHGYVILRNIAGPTPRVDKVGWDGIGSRFDADDTDPANAARFSFDGADDKDRTREEDLKLAEYLLKNGHTTPFEMIEVWFEMQMPIFVARQFVRHRTVSINEVSARYTKLPNQFYIPDPVNVGVKSATNKQGRNIKEGDIENAYAWVNMIEKHCEVSYLGYATSLDNGIPNELARMILPLNIYTKWLWNQDLHNLMHCMKLRLHSHAQFEARAYAQAMYDLLRRVLPHSMDLFDKYRRIEE